MVSPIFQDLEKLWTKGSCQTLGELRNLPAWSASVFVNKRFLPGDIMAITTTRSISSVACRQQMIHLLSFHGLHLSSALMYLTPECPSKYL
jgi:hypothetical protein